jgi:small subunit ribosomal protein S4
MARYTGPKSKVARRFKEAIFGRDKSLERKNYGPGIHGPNKRRPKLSEYAVQLTEKQKAKYTYGVLEKQFRNTFKKAASKKGVTGENLLKLLESRLDNTVYRLGIAPTRRGARQLVSHKHITVNGGVCNIASAMLKPGDVVAVREKSQSLEVITNSISNSTSRFPWLEWNASALQGTFITMPERSDIPENIKEQLIVELYSK